ncbi:MAG: DEAD/DEAH box helicase [Methylococcaceae bacterium]
MTTYRPYQVNSIDSAKDALRRGIKRILIQASTGAGKTVIAARIIELAITKGSRILFVAHRKEIVGQTSAKLSSLGIKHGVIMAGHKAVDAPVQVASVQTLTQREKPAADIIFFDEAHLSVSKSFLDLVEHYDNKVFIGLTATPIRLDGRGLGEIYHEMVQVVPMRELIAQGFLVKPRVFAPFTPDMSSVKTSKGDFDATQTADLMDKSSITGDIIKHWQQHAAGRKTICFASSVEHSKHIAEQFNSVGISARHLDGTTPAGLRDSTLQAWRDGEFDVLSNMGLFIEGLDVPAASCCILARPTQSLTIYMQSVGRVMRPADNKTDCIILDHAGLTYTHGTVDMERDWSLDAKKKKKKGLSAPPVRICQECFCAYHSAAKECPECGNVPEDKKDVTQMTNGDGFLVELEDSHIQFLEEQRIKEQKKIELRNAKTTEQLIDLGRSRNYKNPHGWAARIQEQRHQWSASRG